MDNPSNPTTRIFELPAGEFSTVPAKKADSVKAYKSAESAELSSDSEEFAIHGSNNNVPVTRRDAAEKNTVLGPGIEFNASMLYGAGMSHGTIEISKSGEEVFVPMRMTEVVRFFRDGHMDRKMAEMVMDYSLHGACYVQLSLNREATEIKDLTVSHTRYQYCRVGKYKKGYPTTLFVNPDFGTDDYNTDNTITLPILPPERPWEYIKEYNKGRRKKQLNFIVRVTRVDSGRRYYPDPTWTALIKGGWLEVMEGITDYKRAVLANQTSVKTVVEIHEQYWPQKYKDWNQKSEDDQRDLQKEELTLFTDYLQGSKNAGKLLMCMKKRISGQDVALWEIKILPNEWNNKSAFSDDSRESSTHVVSALGQHQDTIGNVPGSGSLGNSGSSNRVGFNQRVGLAKKDQDLLSWPFIVITEFNGWNPPDDVLVWRWRNSFITTLDSGAERTSPSGDDPNNDGND